MNVTLVCEDNIEGIMTAIYDGWVYMNKGYSVNIHPGSDYAPTFSLNLLILKLTILKLKELFVQ